MEVIQQAGEKLPAESKGTAIALGYFDGVHIGHQAVLGAAAAYAGQQGLAPAVFTFSLGRKPGVRGGALMSEEQRRVILAECGVAFYLAPPFESFCGLSPRDFFKTVLMEQYGAKALFCGDNFAFGKNRSGDVQVLQALCAEHGVYLGIVPTAQYGGAPVSSSRIRAALAAGDVPAVNAMLGRPYEIAFPVKSGKKLGSTMGFPTINQVFPPGLQPPKAGVYITQALVGGKAWPSATGYGSRPTVQGEGETCETFIPGFSGDLYGRAVHVRFYEFIAETKRFGSVQELANAVQGYARQAQEYFKP